MKTKQVFQKVRAGTYFLCRMNKSAFLILVALLLMNMSLSANDLRNKVVVELDNKLYQVNLSVDSNQIVIEKDILQFPADPLKIKQAIRNYLNDKAILQVKKGTNKTNAAQLEKKLNALENVLQDSLMRSIIRQKKAFEEIKSAKVQKAKSDSIKTVKAESIPTTVVKQLNSDKGENTINFSLKDSTISMYVCKLYNRGRYDILSKDHKVMVKSVKMSIEDGIAKDIFILCKDKGDTLSYYIDKTAKSSLRKNCWKNKIYTFSTRHYIPLRDAFDIDELNTEHMNILEFRISPDMVASIDLSDVIRAMRVSTLANGTYISVDTTFTLPLKEPLPMRKNTIVDNLNLKVFTDVMGYDKNSINGVIQTEAKINFLLNTTSTRKASFQHDMEKILFSENRHEWVWINRISPYAKWMRIQNTNTALSLDPTGKGDVMNLFKYATLDLGTDFNVITYRTDSKLFTANLSSGIWRTKIARSSNDSTDNGFWMSTIYLNPTFDFKFYESNRLDFSIGFGAYYAIQLSTITQDDLKNVKSTLTSYDFNSNHLWGQLQECVNFHPNGNWRNSIFLRVSQYWNPRNSHFTCQIGYSTPLGEIFK